MVSKLLGYLLKPLIRWDSPWLPTNRFRNGTYWCSWCLHIMGVALFVELPFLIGSEEEKPDSKEKPRK